MKTSANEKRTVDSFVNDFIKVFSDHEYIVKALHLSAGQLDDDPYTGQWEFQIKEYYHQKMSSDIRRVIQMHGGVSALQMLKTCTQIDRAVDEFFLQNINVSIVMRAKGLVERLSKLLHNLFLPLYLQDMLIHHIETLRKMYLNTPPLSEAVKTHEQWNPLVSSKPESIHRSRI